jgi:hypothetical protein
MPFTQSRNAILAGVLAAAVALSAVSGALAVDPPTAPQPSPPATAKYDRIALTALKYEGQQQGQCWTFAQRVVREATGKSMGFDYRQGFFDAGAVEVSVKDAKSGDIIQIARDSDTSAGADYPGLHTAVILDNNADGTFSVVDSNAHWDGTVRRRDSYAPAEMAGRYNGMNFHIYRIMYDGQAVPPPLPPKTPPPPPPVLRSGDIAVVAADGDCLNLRSTPGGAITKCIPDKTTVLIAA